jgi:hypothetical protein
MPDALRPIPYGLRLAATNEPTCPPGRVRLWRQQKVLASYVVCTRANQNVCFYSLRRAEYA